MAPPVRPIARGLACWCGPLPSSGAPSQIGAAEGNGKRNQQASVRCLDHCVRQTQAIETDLVMSLKFRIPAMVLLGLVGLGLTFAFFAAFDKA